VVAWSKLDEHCPPQYFQCQQVRMMIRCEKQQAKQYQKESMHTLSATFGSDNRKSNLSIMRNLEQKSMINQAVRPLHSHSLRMYEYVKRAALTGMLPTTSTLPTGPQEQEWSLKHTWYTQWLDHNMDDLMDVNANCLLQAVSRHSS
jgi:hypothetical protein